MCNSHDQHAHRTARYLRGELSPEETTAYEVELIANPELYAEARLQLQLIQGLQDHALKRPSLAHRTKRNYRLFSLSLAAAVMFMVTMICINQNDHQAPPMLAGPPGLPPSLDLETVQQLVVAQTYLERNHQLQLSDDTPIIVIRGEPGVELFVLLAEARSTQIVSTQHHL
jgi:hypothetical protein